MEKFWRKATVLGKDDCWIWHAGKGTNGYGRFFYQGMAMNAHRVAFMLAHQTDIPDNMRVLHKCDVRTCVNPAHLFLGTCKDNVQDMMAKGRNRWIPHRYAPRLSESQVQEIKAKLLVGERTSYLAKEYGVNLSTLTRIKTGRSWKHVP